MTHPISTTPAHKPRHIGAKIFVGVAIALFLGLVAFVVGLLQTKLQADRYFTQLMYTMGGSTAVVETENEDGITCALSSVNQRALYGFLADNYGDRKRIRQGNLTGNSIRFVAKSAVGTAIGTVEETDTDYVSITFQVGNEKWHYYVNNRAPYEYYSRVASPEGWTTENTVTETTLDEWLAEEDEE
jgi:hypothetical protein